MTKASFQAIAAEVIDAVRPDGTKVSVEARIGQPYEITPEEWACPVALEGLHRHLGDIHGGSSLQALCLAASLLRNLLTDFVAKGGRLLHAGSVEEFSIDATFSSLGSKDPDHAG